MELVVNNTDHVPETAVVSVRCGQVRRQAPLKTVKSSSMKFPSSLSSCMEPLKIDVLLPVATAHLVLLGREESYRVALDGKSSLGQDMSIGFSVRDNPELFSQHFGGPPKDAGGRLSSLASLEARGAPAEESPKPSWKNPDAANAAREYLDKHGLLRYVQSLLQAVIQCRPKDPYSFMVEQLSYAEGVKLPARRTSSSSAKDECCLRGGGGAAPSEMSTTAGDPWRPDSACSKTPEVDGSAASNVPQSSSHSPGAEAMLMPMSPPPPPGPPPQRDFVRPTGPFAMSVVSSKVSEAFAPAGRSSSSREPSEVSVKVQLPAGRPAAAARRRPSGGEEESNKASPSSVERTGDACGALRPSHLSPEAQDKPVRARSKTPTGRVNPEPGAAQLAPSAAEEKPARSRSKGPSGHQSSESSSGQLSPPAAEEKPVRSRSKTPSGQTCSEHAGVGQLMPPQALAAEEKPARSRSKTPSGHECAERAAGQLTPKAAQDTKQQSPSKSLLTVYSEAKPQRGRSKQKSGRNDEERPRRPPSEHDQQLEDEAAMPPQRSRSKQPAGNTCVVDEAARPGDVAGGTALPATASVAKVLASPTSSSSSSGSPAAGVKALRCNSGDAAAGCDGQGHSGTVPAGTTTSAVHNATPDRMQMHWQLRLLLSKAVQSGVLQLAVAQAAQQAASEAARERKKRLVRLLKEASASGRLRELVAEAAARGHS
eukprot:TRINITY_DN6769_c0_g1_i2.p1 TRINITY_DN6769_c0_g1~~TRINITY_DN6769_c0_g1_i2.p1  ORF type:complete len:710 (-),score=141.31 TRINITY_DN6769_c0_g1_i2:324-2453(-)